MHIELPSWIDDVVPPPNGALREQRMRFVIELAQYSVRHGGGPFAAAIFNIESGECVGRGVNLVHILQCSMLHAEVVAIVEAERVVGAYSLSQRGRFELYSSAEPCAMCLGAIPWSGVQRLVCAARDEDIRAIGFDEGMKPQPWSEALTSRGIDVVVDVLRAEAVEVLVSYKAVGGIMYNG